MSTASLSAPSQTWIGKFVDDIRASLWPQTDDELRLVDEQLNLASNGTWTNVIIVPLSAICVALTNSDWVPLPRLVAWPLAISAACVGANLHYWNLWRRADHSPADIGHRARTYTVLVLLQTFVWCLAVPVLWAPGNGQNHAILILMMACSISGWTSVGAFHLATAITSMPLYLVSLAVIPLIDRSPHGWALSVACVSFWALMQMLLLNNYRTREHMIRLEQERGELIDDLKVAKEQSDTARERAEISSNAKSAFLANMSHELRTPLNAILGFSEIISTKAMGEEISNQYAEYAEHIHGSGQQLLSLINDILDLAKIEAGRLNLRETDVDISRLMRDLTLTFKIKAQTAGLYLRTNIDETFPGIFADERALRQILANLISNAIKFTPPNGHVTAFANVLADGSLVIGVEDSGVGIAPEDHEKVFESFGQGRHDAVQADVGTGLGLPIVRGLAEAHGGRVNLDSHPDIGTRVTVTLPASRARPRMRQTG